MHWIKDGKLVFRIENTGEEYAIPVSKEACLAHLSKETSAMHIVSQAITNLAAIKKWGDEYIRFHRENAFHGAKQAKLFARQFMKAKGITEGAATARMFFELALPQLEKGGSFLGPETEQNVELVELNDKKVHARIRACPLYATWKKAGISDEDCVKLCRLDCMSSLDIGMNDSENFDEAFAHTLNPKLQYRVHQCLPQGKEYCDITQEIED